MQPLFIRLGTSDEVLCCDCCGNTELSHTVVLEHVDSGEVVHFGSVCAVAACHPWARLSDRYAGFQPDGVEGDE
jgi:hypothetical protein